MSLKHFTEQTQLNGLLASMVGGREGEEEALAWCLQDWASKATYPSGCSEVVMSKLLLESTPSGGVAQVEELLCYIQAVLHTAGADSALL